MSAKPAPRTPVGMMEKRRAAAGAASRGPVDSKVATREAFLALCVTAALFSRPPAAAPPNPLTPLPPTPTLNKQRWRHQD